jgi:hypothetical protein
MTGYRLTSSKYALVKKVTFSGDLIFALEEEFLTHILSNNAVHIPQ